MLLSVGPGRSGRHFREPLADGLRGKIHRDELLYVLGTNMVFWLGALEEIFRSSIRGNKNRSVKDK